MRVFVDTIGCRLNQSEIEAIASQFRAAGHTLVSQASEADLVVVNTCAVTAEAASDSRQKIRQAARGGAKEIAVTGCWATLNPQGAAALPGVTHVFPNDAKDSLVAKLLHSPPDAFDQEPIARQPLPGAHLRTRAFIKVQDGCDNRCTFCVTTLARGSGRSRGVATVKADVQSALLGGSQEIVLTGVHLGSWGQDFAEARHLKDLVSALLGETDVPRLRLSSLEPWDLSADFFSLWADRRMCRHLHLPLQSGAEKTLRRMARKTRPDSFAGLVADARRWIPGVAVTTDVIVGFPGETEAEYEESLEFVRRMQFAGGHVFSYSPRPGTAAAKFPGQVPMAVRKERSARMRAVLADASRQFRAGFIGQILPVLWEAAQGVGPDGWHLSGLTDNYLRVSALAPGDLWNQITPVDLTEVTFEGLRGTIL